MHLSSLMGTRKQPFFSGGKETSSNGYAVVVVGVVDVGRDLPQFVSICKKCFSIHLVLSIPYPRPFPFSPLLKSYKLKFSLVAVEFSAIPRLFFVPETGAKGLSIFYGSCKNPYIRLKLTFFNAFQTKKFIPSCIYIFDVVLN